MKEYRNTKKQNEPNLGNHGGIAPITNYEQRTFYQNEPNFPIFQPISRVLKTCIPVFLCSCIPAYLYTCILAYLFHQNEPNLPPFSGFGDRLSMADAGQEFVEVAGG
jgi:hypothetical protein